MGPGNKASISHAINVATVVTRASCNKFYCDNACVTLSSANRLTKFLSNKLYL